MIGYLGRIGIIALVGWLSVGCADSEQASSATDSPGQASALPRAEPPADLGPAARAIWLIEAARAAYAESQAAGHAWVSARTALDSARAAADRGDYAAAGSEGEKALRLAEASLAQARAEEDAWRDRFPKQRAQ